MLGCKIYLTFQINDMGVVDSEKLKEYATSTGYGDWINEANVIAEKCATSESCKLFFILLR